MSRLASLLIGVGTAVAAVVAILAFIFNLMDVRSHVGYTWNRWFGEEKRLSVEITTVGQFVELAKGKMADGSVEIYFAEDGLLDELSRLRVDPEREIRRFAGEDYRAIAQQICQRMEPCLGCAWSSEGEEVELSLRRECTEESEAGLRYLVCRRQC